MNNRIQTFTWYDSISQSHNWVNALHECIECIFIAFNLFIWSKFSFNYKIKDGNEKGDFQINANSGLIRTAAILDQNATRSYHLSVVAEDLSDTCHKGLMLVKVIVLDKNYTKPKFEKPQYSINVPEDVLVNHHLIRVSFFNKFIRTQSRYF